MDLVVRVLYNNQSWQAPCKKPGSDRLCWQCFREDDLDITGPSISDEICTGHCWEQHLCTDYRWGCYPKGRNFGSRAYSGQKVYFIFRQPDGKYTVWGKTSIQDIDKKPMEQGKDDEKGFAFMHFNSFKPLIKDKWIVNLSDRQLVGEEWRQGRYRFIDAKQSAYIEDLIKGLTPGKQPAGGSTIQHELVAFHDLSLSPKIYEKLENIANEEGRKMDDIVREGIAEWLRTRK